MTNKDKDINKIKYALRDTRWVTKNRRAVIKQLKYEIKELTRELKEEEKSLAENLRIIEKLKKELNNHDETYLVD